MTEEGQSPFTQAQFARLDESDDSLFYQQPRLVVHIDEQAIATIGKLFEDVIPPHSVILDLLSSWRSHWPSSRPEGHSTGPEQKAVQAPESQRGLEKSRMVGLGLNAVEMRENPDLDEYVVQDVNKDPHLPFEDNTFDAVVITVSIQYLTRPVEVFRDVNRVLKPAGIFLVIFSNRMFPDKAVRIWTALGDEERMKLLASYFYYAGNYEEIKGICRNPQRGPFEDPVYVVMARKPAN